MSEMLAAAWIQPGYKAGEAGAGRSPRGLALRTGTTRGQNSTSSTREAVGKPA